jgi:hypothetical protein
VRSPLEKAANYGSYELDARIGMRVTTALDTIARYEGWQRQQEIETLEKQ